MKRWISSLLLCLLLVGCGRSGKPLFDPVYFYYPRVANDYVYADSGITWEAMDGTGRMGDYEYLMAQYFEGPIDEGLTNPFPPGTALLAAWVEEDVFYLELSEQALALPAHRFSLGCSCLSMTCFELTEVSAVTVSCAQQCITIHRDGMLLIDDYLPQP